MPSSSPALRTSHDDYSANCSRVACQHLVVGGSHVQVRTKGAVLCGQVLDLAKFERGAERDWFKVRTSIATGWVPASNVRLCSGLDDQLCQCEALATVVES